MYNTIIEHINSGFKTSSVNISGTIFTNGRIHALSFRTISNGFSVLRSFDEHKAFLKGMRIAKFTDSDLLKYNSLKDNTDELFSYELVNSTEYINSLKVITTFYMHLYNYIPEVPTPNIQFVDFEEFLNKHHETLL